ncbi:MAG: AmmeMemoRadiSam system protein B [Candidatus Magasanikbacteria bacterium]
MSLVFAAITPHPPLLIPNIGGDEIKKVKKTQEAFAKLEEELYLSKPQIIVIISPHGKLFSDMFTVNAFTEFKCNFKEFGDFSTTHEWKGAPDLAARVMHMANIGHIPLQMVSGKEIDHGAGVPLHYLSAHLPEIKILPIGYSNLDTKSHLDFGKLLKEACMETDKRVALIASGDLSHGLTTDAPAGFKKRGKEFDQKLIELLESHNTTGVATLDSKFVEEAAECGYRSILILLGALQNMDFKFKNYAYESPFGVGYLTGEFVFE